MPNIIDIQEADDTSTLELLHSLFKSGCVLDSFICLATKANLLHIEYLHWDGKPHIYTVYFRNGVLKRIVNIDTGLEFINNNA